MGLNVSSMKSNFTDLNVLDKETISDIITIYTSGLGFDHSITIGYQNGGICFF